MSAITIAGDTSGSITLDAPAVAGTTVLTLPARSGSLMVNGPAFSAFQSSAQTVSTTTFTKVQLQTEEFDTASAFDSTTTYRFTPTVAGYYQVNGTLGVSATATSITLMVYKNGVRFKDGSSTNSGGNSSSLAALIYLNGTTDYLELYVYLTNGQALAASASATFFQASMVRSA
jgi:hypothetical protein